MPNTTITALDHADMDDILASDERLLWSGQPAYGRRFFQITSNERIMIAALVLGAIAMWGTWPFIDIEGPLDRSSAAWVFGVVTAMFVLFVIWKAGDRQFVLRNLAYFVTTKRAIVCRRGRNWRFSERVYLISCSHDFAHTYTIIPSKPYPSLQVGILLSYDSVQPLGLGLAHPGQPILWNRINSPVVFEYVPEAQEIFSLIQYHVD